MMEFVRKGKWYSESRQGYRVSAAKVRERLVYSAWAPRAKVPGERFPQPVSLGCFRHSDPKVAAEQAKQACREHYETNSGQKSLAV